MIHLTQIPKSDIWLKHWMLLHYSSPFGFVGRQIIYKITADGKQYGAIAGGSATMHLPGRADFFGYFPLNSIVNNTFYHVQKVEGKYPVHNFTTKVVEIWRYLIQIDWQRQYGDAVIGFETLVEPPRTGELYKRDGWKYVGTTKGLTAKRESESVFGKSTDSYSGRRVWDTKNLRPKLVFVRQAD